MSGQGNLFVAGARAERLAGAGGSRARGAAADPAGPPPDEAADDPLDDPTRRRPWHLDVMRDEVAREINMRETYFGRLVREGKMKPAERDMRIGTLRCNLALIEQLMRAEQRLIAIVENAGGEIHFCKGQPIDWTERALLDFHIMRIRARERAATPPEAGDDRGDQRGAAGGGRSPAAGPAPGGVA